MYEHNQVRTCVHSDLLSHKYLVIKTLGSGSSGEINLCKNLKDEKKYVVKSINILNSNDREKKAAALECSLLSHLKHPSIVPFKESFKLNGILYISMVFCEGGDLYAHILNQNGFYFCENQIIEWLVQILMAIQYMHSRNVLHRDLKTKNIFLTCRNLIKVGDFGISRVLSNASSMATTMIGTPFYMSPELLNGEKYNYKSDIWSLGCVLYELASLKRAFIANDLASLSHKILNKKACVLPDQYSQHLTFLINYMLASESEKRPSAHQLLRNTYIQKHMQLFLKKRTQRKFIFNVELTHDDSFTNRISESKFYSQKPDRSNSHPCLTRFHSEKDISWNVFEIGDTARQRRRIIKLDKADHDSCSYPTQMKNFNLPILRRPHAIKETKHNDLPKCCEMLKKPKRNSHFQNKFDDTNKKHNDVQEFLPLAQTTRRSLSQSRYEDLCKICIRGMGERKFLDVCAILDQGINVESKTDLIQAILGDTVYDKYMVKIWQLKLFE